MAETTGQASVDQAAVVLAEKILGDILSFFGLNVVVSSHFEDDVIELSVPSTQLNGFLIGQRGDTLRSLQTMVAAMLRATEASVTRVNIDIAGYKKQRAEKLQQQLAIWVAELRAADSTSSKSLAAMSPVDRRTIHRGLADYTDISSRSEGEGRDRHIILSLEA